MVGFSLDETIKYFADRTLEPVLVEGLYQPCGRGIPGHLASARRNILAGQDPQTLLKAKLTDLFEKEWNQALNDELSLQALAIIAHALHRPTVEELTRLSGHDKDRVRAMLEGISFLTIDDRTSEVSFDSDAFWKFATTKLRDRREQVIDLIIDDLIARPESEVTAWTEAGENALDMAYTRLSLATLGASNLTNEPHDTIEVIRDRIKDPKLWSLTTAISLAVGNQTAQEVIAQVEKMKTTEDRLYLLRQWAVDSRERPEAADVVEYALDLAIKTAAYAPNARVLRELAAPLPFMQDQERARRLVGIFDGQKNTVEHIGPTEDYVRLQLLLARTERKYDTAACSNRIDEVYLYIHYEIDDLAVKASCLAWLLAAVKRIDPDGELEANGQIRHLTSTDLKSNVDALLQETAEHFQSTRNIIQALSVSNPEMGLDLVMRLNTQDRRNKAILKLIDVMMDSRLETLNFDILERALKSFLDQDACGEAITRIVECLSAEKNFPRPTLHKVLPFINRISEIRSARLRCQASCLAYSLLSRFDEAGEYNSLRSQILHLLSESWRSIEVGWAKVDTGFQIVRLLAEHDPDLARDYLAQTESARKGIAFNANATAWTYQTCLRMAVRAFAGLLPHHIDSESDYARLQALIEHLPSSGERAKIWAELAERCFIARRSDDGKRIVTEHVKPLLYAIPDADELYRADIIVSVAPALYMAHAPTAKELIRCLPQPHRDSALFGIAEFILRKRPLSDPYEPHAQGYNVDFEAILDITEIIREIERDGYVYLFIESIAETIGSSHLRDRFTRQQRADDEYPRHWRRISDQDPPETEIVIVGIESSGKSPIHDRCWLTKGAGLEMGTSFNSLGKTQDSTITRISEAKAKLLESNVDQYLVDKKRDYNGERLRYFSVTL